MSDFSTEGREVFPSLHQDEQQVAGFSEWPQEALEERYHQYIAFLNQDPRPMPRARETAERVLGHLIFELTWRGSQELGVAIM